ncbi:dihydroxyacetone kinase subunit DhaK [Paenibacillus thiaminolyticus]|uniref:Dihydroxyacetone kinase subunit DhaK n=1 Tax=Paenibacillus thiaminolyticus TaxID=49283 RepID=A0AAP9DZC6_PANTH|nr:dihydroxyacetone kinase subunit DhaK [Paenibacillus thiaminolyticus]MCY9537651.1 dihydroxyacetone kinase subunit DhaK [Paenibacillus thiaminolyticus]MCY9601732.1 dihydroxyacetone kinase subunit DhaK [Paenibacillus thiaminolyticus]MCY9607136.1 dihydroxyacetone kinase subunit DhaK [Paenibacillus thiaminolyticus]MCY9614176.1 dihydroxyacetone kinase subunit DhaK [Paenibacillus thiaminolyticus]MCY9619267.1 dihydroxyacetone kinase subunit DhaK [Paenibacillus thiaminolyticus]
MKKLINAPNDVVEEMIAGFAAAHPQHVRRLPEHNRSLVTAKDTAEGKVGILIGGGAGHEPAFMGYVGAGMADGVAVGNIFASPPPDPILEATKAIDKGEGVVFIYGNYAGDVMNFGMAAELAALDYGIPVGVVIVTDDVASAPAEERDNRRGIAGEFLVTKVAGAAAAQGYSLSEVVRVSNKANARTRSMGVGLTPCSLPQTGQPSFELEADEMEIGLGHHGEPGIEKGPLQTADRVAERLVHDILADMPLEPGSRTAVLVNGLGSTTRMELYIVFRRVEQLMSDRGIIIHRSYVGEYSTSLEMGGCSVTVLHLDDELEELIDYPADCPMYVQK